MQQTRGHVNGTSEAPSMHGAFAGHGSRLRDVHIRVLGHEYGTRGRSRLWDGEDPFTGRNWVGRGRRSGRVGRSR